MKGSFFQRNKDRISPSTEQIIFSDPCEYMAPTDTYSPVLHRIDQAVRFRAVHPTEPIPPPYEILTRYSKPPDELVDRAKRQLDNLIAAADVKKGIPAAPPLLFHFQSTPLHQKKPPETLKPSLQCHRKPPHPANATAPTSRPSPASTSSPSSGPHQKQPEKSRPIIPSPRFGRCSTRPSRPPRSARRLSSWARSRRNTSRTVSGIACMRGRLRR